MGEPLAEISVAAPVKVKLPRAFCCRQIVELLSAEIAAEGDVVRAVQPEQVGRQGAGLEPIIGCLSIGNPTDAGGKLQARRSPIDRALVVTADAEISRNIHAVGEIRSDT